MITPLKSTFIVLGALASAATLSISGATPATAAEEVNVYSYRQPFLITPMFDAFTEKTGIKVNVIFAKKGLIERAAEEAMNSPMDVLLTTDIGNLVKAKEAGITGSLSDATINANIPKNLRDPEGHWFALTTRARVAYMSKAKLDASKGITYEDLAKPEWKGKICTRSGAHNYNIALIASMISHHGDAGAKTWLEGIKANLARKPQGNDRAQVKAVYEGQCDVAIGNTYYMGAMMTNDKNPEQKEWAAAVNVVFPNSKGRGTHVNISGMVIGAHAPNQTNAVKLMQFLTGDDAQALYAKVNHEYPVKPGVEWSELVKGWGAFSADDLSLAEIAANRKRALELVNEVGYDS